MKNKPLIALLVLIGGMIAINAWLSKVPTTQEELIQSKMPKKVYKLFKSGTMTPGRVVELKTTKGSIEFVLFEKDCPENTKKVVEMASNGAYDNKLFQSVDEQMIQTEAPISKGQTVPTEACTELSHVAGAVGMARRGDDMHSGNGVFYILKKPQTSLDGRYTVFGQLINGMDAMTKMQDTDKIIMATIRDRTADDENKYTEATKQAFKNGSKSAITLGRVVELKTTKGILEFVLYEKNCPENTKKIVDLVSERAYDGTLFPRVEDWLIQTDRIMPKSQTVPTEAYKELLHAKGAVGMVRTANDTHSGMGKFYILKEPQPSLDGIFSVFGRIINGMDAVLNMTNKDRIIKATVRDRTKEDESKFNEMLKIEVQRKTQ